MYTNIEYHYNSKKDMVRNCTYQAQEDKQDCKHSTDDDEILQYILQW